MQWTARELSRQASQAVRLSLRNANFADALLLVNSVRYAATSPAVSSKKFAPIAARLHPACSPRLPAHTLLHGLLRAGMPDKASAVAGQMIHAGIRVRARSLDAVFTALAHPAPAPAPTRPIVPPTSHILTLYPQLSDNPGTQHAIGLLNIAREYHHGRTRSMFKTLITLCIINGEIILASLLFGILVRDWQARELLAASAVSSSEEPESLTPRPSRSLFHKICLSIRRSLLQDAPHPLNRQASLQALANMAYLLDHKLIPISNVSPLISAIHHCPRTDALVWIPDPDRQVNAYDYVHEVLVRLILDLPRHFSPRQDTLPPLDTASYASLLHYALRHQHSIDMANQLLHNMTLVRGLKTNEVITNIIDRSADIMGDSKVLHELAKYRKVTEPPAEPQSDLESLLSLIPSHEWDRAIPFDRYALTTRMASLISTGKPDVVAATIPHLFPHLFSKSAPRKQTILRASLLGPIVFTCLLNALQKTGKTGWAERVWKVAQEAEERSWNPLPHHASDHLPIVQPWCLPIEAYTIMIKVYAAEFKKGMALQDSQNSDSSDKRLVKGWGHAFLHQFWPRQEFTRDELGRPMALSIYNLALAAAERISQNIETLQALESSQPKPVHVRLINKAVVIPKPNERFFNAILDVVGRRPGMVKRRQGSLRSKAYWRNVNKRVRERYLYSDEKPRGMVPATGDDPLKEVAKKMLEHGYAIPLVFRRLLVGEVQCLESEGVRREVRTPVALSSKKSSVDTVGRTMIPVQHTKGKLYTKRHRSVVV